MTNLTEHTRKYLNYEYDVSERFMVPLLCTWGVELDGARVLDVGCAEGESVCALYDQGAVCHGFDIDVQRIQAAVELTGKRRTEFGTENHYLNQLPYGSRQFELVARHDVCEHLDRKEKMLEKLRSYFSPAWPVDHNVSTVFFRIRCSSTAAADVVRPGTNYPSPATVSHDISPPPEERESRLR